MNNKDISVLDKEFVKYIENIEKECVSVKFDDKDYKVPKRWSNTANKIAVQKYFKRGGIPKVTTIHKDDIGLPRFMQRAVFEKNVPTTYESSIIQVINRIAGCLTRHGYDLGYFNKESEPMIEAFEFYKKLFDSMFYQKCFPNSPQWFNTGLNFSYGITSKSTTPYYKIINGKVEETYENYENPQVHACFIKSIEDNLIGEGGIFHSITEEAKIFRNGSGVGSNFSALRGKGEKLSLGGSSSGVLSFLEVFDKAAGAVKSGGTTRRSAKMVILDVNHGDIFDFINWKTGEEDKVSALHIGNHYLNNGDTTNLNSTQERLKSIKEQGYDYALAEIDLDWQGIAFSSVSGQNSNNSIRVTDKFMSLLDKEDDSFELLNRDGSVKEVVSANKIYDAICVNSWASGDPALQYHDRINEDNTCPNDGEIVASNPCSEYMFLNDTACNLASINLGNIDLKSTELERITKLWITALDISVSIGLYPTKKIAEGTLNYRTLGLGFANLGTVFVRELVSYGSQESCRITSEIMGRIQAAAYDQSIKLGEMLGSFPRFEANKEHVIRVNQRQANINPNEKVTAFRNAQLTCIAPTGTIGLVMDCDALGIEPILSIAQHKTLSGGGYLKIVPSVYMDALKKVYLSKKVTNFKDFSINNEEFKATLEGKDYDLTNQSELLSLVDILTGSNESIRKVFYTSFDKCDLTYQDHLNVMAACQPSVSGAISKTINLREEATINDVKEVYKKAYKMGIKAITVYRNNSKLSQAIYNDNDKKDEATKEQVEIISKFYENTNSENETKAERKKLPSRRVGYTQKATIGGHRLYLRTGEYQDGSLGEIFVDMYKEGNMTTSLLNAFAIAISLGLQYGVPLNEYVEAFTNMKFEPNGVVQGHDDLKMCQSILDFIFKDLAINYAGNKSFSHTIKENEENSDVFERTEYLQKHELKSTVGNESYAYSGKPCTNCGSMNMRPNGTCFVCQDCGTTTGCA